MKLELNFVAGPLLGKVNPLDKKVVRIGSHPNGDVCIPSKLIPSQMAVIEIKGGNEPCRIYNRSEINFDLASQAIEPGESVDWRIGESLQLPDGSIIELVASTAQDMEEPPMSYNDHWDDKSGSNQNSEVKVDNENNSSTSIQLAVIAVCLIAIGVIVYTQFVLDPDKPLKLNSSLDPASVVKIVKSNAKTPAEIAIRDMILNTEFALSKGDKESAKVILRQLQRFLARRMESGFIDFEAEESQLLLYSAERLTQEE